MTVPDLVVRTASNNPGHPHGLAVGAGPSVADALENLETEAHRQAEELAAEFAGDERDDTDWLFQVVDVKLTAGPQDSRSDEQWVALGTLVSRGATPWSASYWDESR